LALLSSQTKEPVLKSSKDRSRTSSTTRTPGTDKAAGDPEGDDDAPAPAPTAGKLKPTVHGFANLDLLLPSIPISQCIVPILHIKLGLGYYLLTYILDFISTHIEWESDSVVAAAIKLELQEAAVATACADRDAYKSLVPKPPGHAAILKALSRRNVSVFKSCTRSFGRSIIRRR